MNPLDTTLASAGTTQLTLSELLHVLHRQGKLEPLVRETLAGKAIEEHARQTALEIATEDLQAAADTFRRQRGLTTAAETHQWLQSRQLSVVDFEEGLAHDLIVFRVREDLTKAKVPDHYVANKDGYEELALMEVVVPREDQARELASQIREEGKALPDAARESKAAMARTVVQRRALAPAMAAALKDAKPGDLVGPIASPQGFHLVLLEATRPADLTPALAQRIQQELFDSWLSQQMKESRVDLSLLNAS